MRALTIEHCDILNFDRALVGQVDQLDGTSTARICSSCRSLAAKLPTHAYREAQYIKNEEAVSKIIFVQECDHTAVEFILEATDAEHYVRTAFVNRSQITFFGVYIQDSISTQAVLVAACAITKGSGRKSYWDFKSVYT
jgi:hypothetical protein